MDMQVGFCSCEVDVERINLVCASLLLLCAIDVLGDPRQTLGEISG